VDTAGVLDAAETERLRSSRSRQIEGA